MSTYEPALPALRQTIDRKLAEVLDARSHDIPETRPLVGEIRRVIAAGGKRLRPSFCFWGFRAAGGYSGDEIVNAAAALELLHTFAIVHDDIMDAATDRRGVPTVNMLRGDEVALLVGDLALVLADDLLMRSGFSPEMVARGFVCYSRMRQEVIAGQYLDLQAATSLEIDEMQARRIAVLKSGRYSVEEPLAIGATLGGAAPPLLEQLERFGAPLGEAFQLRDDLLGTFGRSQATGKSVDSDMRQGKRNILFAATLARLDGGQRAFFTRRWGAGDALTQEEVGHLRALVESSGARAATEALLSDLTRRVALELAGLQIDEASREALGDLSRLAVERDS